MLRITLKIDGADKTFAPTFVKGRVFRNTFKLVKIVSDTSNMDEGTSDELVNYLCDVFDNQFTIDQFYDGIDCREIIPTFVKCTQEIMGNAPNPNV